MRSSISQQTLMLLDGAYKSFFKNLKNYKSNPLKYKGCPKAPRFKDKEKGRFITTFTDHAISKKYLKEGLIKLSSLNFTIPNNIKNIKQIRIIPKNKRLYCIEIIYEVQEKPIVINYNYAGIDIGLNNLAAIATSDCKTFLVNGRPLKSINQFYNKKTAVLRSKLPNCIDKNNTLINIGWSKYMNSITRKRNNKITDYLHKASRKVVTKLKQENISKVVIGKNNQWKDSINIGSKNNQNFVLIPHSKFIDMLVYKLKLEGIEVILREESYTSICSFVDNEAIQKHSKYKGNRIKRGLFKSKNGLLINADINGACNILKKEIPNAFVKGIDGVSVSPLHIL